MQKIKSLFASTIPMMIGFAIQYVLVIYFAFLASFFMFAIAPGLTGRIPSQDDIMNLLMDMDFNTIVMIAFSVICTVIFSIWYYKSCGGELKPNFKKNFHPLQFAGVLLMVPGTQFFTNILISVIATIFPKWLEDYQAMMEAAGMGEEVTLLMMIYSVCLAPISEELIFRGVTMRLARKAFPFWVANFIQAFLFGVFHMNPLQGCYAFTLGLVLGYVCERGGSIYYAILFHFLFNLWGTTSQWMASIDEMLLGTIIILGSLILLPAGMLLYNMGIHRREQTS